MISSIATATSDPARTIRVSSVPSSGTVTPGVVDYEPGRAALAHPGDARKRSFGTGSLPAHVDPRDGQQDRAHAQQRDREDDRGAEVERVEGHTTTPSLARTFRPWSGHVMIPSTSGASEPIGQR